MKPDLHSPSSNKNLESERTYDRIGSCRLSINTHQAMHKGKHAGNMFLTSGIF